MHSDPTLGEIAEATIRAMEAEASEAIPGLALPMAHAELFFAVVASLLEAGTPPEDLRRYIREISEGA